MSGSSVTPVLTLSCAISLDGFLDDDSSQRLVLSSPEDLAEVMRLRAQSDMIVIGAETLRRDNPSLATRGEANFALRSQAGKAAHPAKLVVTQSGSLPLGAAFFQTGDGERIVLSTDAACLPELRNLATVESFHGDWMSAVRAVAQARGIRDVMIEGGAQIVRAALQSPLLRRWRLAIAPVVLGSAGRASIVEAGQSLDQIVRRLNVVSAKKCADTTVLEIEL